MNEMYEMSQSIHIFSVIAMVFTLIILMTMHKLNTQQTKFVKNVSVVSVFHSSFLGAAALTGMVMMAAKHLSFTSANILMIISLVVLITLEIRRNKMLKMVVKFQRVDLDVYKKVAFNYELIELVLILGIGAFAGMAG